MALSSDTKVLTGPNFRQRDLVDIVPFQVTFYQFGTPAATNQAFFVAPAPCQIMLIEQVHGVAAGGTSTLTVEKDTGTTAAGSGTAVMSNSFNLNATANTPQTATLKTDGTATLAAGDRLAVNFANTIQSTSGLVVTVWMVPA